MQVQISLMTTGIHQKYQQPNSSNCTPTAKMYDLMENIQSRTGLARVRSEDSVLFTADDILRKLRFGQWVVHTITPNITSGLDLKKESKMQKEDPTS